MTRAVLVVPVEDEKRIDVQFMFQVIFNRDAKICGAGYLFLYDLL